MVWHWTHRLPAEQGCRKGGETTSSVPLKRSYQRHERNPRAIDQCKQHLKRSKAITLSRTAGLKGDTVGMAWAASSTAATFCWYRIAGLLPADLHTPVLGVSSRAVLPPENTAQQNIV